MQVNEILIEFVPKELIRNNDVGDYFKQNNTLVIRALKMNNLDYSYMIGLHELLEAWRSERRGISELAIDKFDSEHSELESPGDHPEAPYKEDHRFSENIERLICFDFGINWFDYEQAIKDSYATGL